MTTTHRRLVLGLHLFQRLLHRTQQQRHRNSRTHCQRNYQRLLLVHQLMLVQWNRPPHSGKILWPLCLCQNTAHTLNALCNAFAHLSSFPLPQDLFCLIPMSSITAPIVCIINFCTHDTVSLSLLLQCFPFGYLCILPFATTKPLILGLHQVLYQSNGFNLPPTPITLPSYFKT